MRTDRLYNYVGIIPARYASSRFPGKPLALIGDKTLIERVYIQAQKSIDLIYVATDDTRIYDKVVSFGGNAVMTSPDHKSGTDRCSEAVTEIERITGTTIDIVVNIQGDEPFIRPEQIDLLTKCFSDKNVEIATLVRQAESGEDIFNTNQPKVVLNTLGDAIYFSRAAIPYLRDAEVNDWSGKHPYFKHIGLYAYKKEILKTITKLPQSSLELAESLEQNRWIENGFRIRVAITNWESIGIDSPEDLVKAKKYLENLT